MKVKSESEVAQSCLTLTNPMDCSLPGSSIHEIFQARVLEWGAIAFSETKTRRVIFFYSLKCVFSIYFYLEDNCFTILCGLLPYINMNQPQVYICWRRQWQSTPLLLPGRSHGQRSLVGCSPWDLEESDTTERLHFHFQGTCPVVGLMSHMVALFLVF